MILRRVYGALIRLHPAYFRKRYEEEMLWIFDEALRTHGAWFLLFDGFLSLIRQWVSRPFPGSGMRAPAFLDGRRLEIGSIQWKAWVSHRRTQVLNTSWRLATLGLAAWILGFDPSPMLNFITIMVSIELILGHRRLEIAEKRRNASANFSMLADPDRVRRERLEVRRDLHQEWAHWRGPAIGVLFVCVIALIAAILRSYLRDLPLQDLSRFEFFVPTAIAALIFERVIVARANRRAARTIQTVIDSESPHSTHD